ncbi:High-affinity fructose transporter ght6 [Cytospora mali]|uniref:High-affinity fructose transporter ght6 n=1 Tax=Cytospora mali TaxID=578113 RepID=A0A194VRX5_CYTMA|nr:High-affinity fructose transporter ght6 [Valsa mali]
MLSLNGRVNFDHVNPNHEKCTDARRELAHLDYSPLKRVTGRSFCMGLLVSMGGLIFGYDTGQISGFLEMPDFLKRFGGLQSDGSHSFSTIRSGLIVGLLSIGTLVGALLAAPVADKLGRRPSITLWSIVVAAGFIIQVASETAWQQIMVGRLVAGFGVGALSLLVPMFQAETAPPWIRGALVCTYQLFITLGIFLAACFNYGTYTYQRDNSGSWRIVISIGWLWTLVLGLGIWGFKETPRFVYRRGRVEEAKQTLMRVYGAPENHYAIYVQMEEMESKFRAEMQRKNTAGPIGEIIDMCKAPRMVYRILLGVMLQMFQQLTGANYFFYYGTTIFTSVQISSFVTQVILNAINFAVTFIGLYFVEHYGRRKCLIFGSIWMFVFFMVFASVGHFVLDVNDPSSTPEAGIALIVMACLFILGYATTWGPMVWTLIAEIYPSKYRAKGMALATASNWTWNFLLAFFTPFITKDIDFALGYVFAGCNLIGGILVYFFVIEGQGRTLEEIDTMYLENVNPRESAKWVPPPAEEMARIRRLAGTEDDPVAGSSEYSGDNGKTESKPETQQAETV